MRTSADHNDNSPKGRLRRAVFYAARLSDGGTMFREGGGIEAPDSKDIKTLETQVRRHCSNSHTWLNISLKHFLELIDS